MSYRYMILGAGMQGTAAAYDLAKFTRDSVVVLADREQERAMSAAERVNRLVGMDCCSAAQVDVLDQAQLAEALSNTNLVLSCVPYWMHPSIAKAAIDVGANMCDLGGNTDVTTQTLSLNGAALEKGVTLVPDCGLAPGLVNSLALYLIEKLDICDTVRLYCGVLPQHPKPPFNYKLTFNIEGLVTEYDYKALVLRDGRIAEVDTLSELETIQIEPLGEMEAFTTSGGVSTAVMSFEGRIKNYEYKTIRFPGHCERMRIFKDFGFWSEEPVEVKGGSVRPKDLFCKVFGDSLGKIQDTDQCAIRAIAEGEIGGRSRRLQVDLFDRQCEETGFTSMERLTGFSLSIIAQHVASGKSDKGCIRYEAAMRGKEFVEEFEKRGILLKYQEF